jgi:predicted O-methyltransferase YrrM
MNNRSLMLPEEYEAILDIIPQKGIVLEIGTFHGLTVSRWASERPNIIFFSVDPLQRRGAGLKWYENRKPNMRLLTGTIGDLELLNARHAFDVIIVDGDHSYAACHNDLETGLSLIKPKCPFAVHDYAKGTLRRTTARAVIRAVDDFCNIHRYKIDSVIGTTAFLKACDES